MFSLFVLLGRNLRTVARNANVFFMLQLRDARVPPAPYACAHLAPRE